MQIEDSDAEDEEPGVDRDSIANQLFDPDDVSVPSHANLSHLLFLSASLNIRNI